ncbi:MAG: hypothetical protein K2I00_01350 [Ruminococcus sp.]|nr:hypothetical protein [Ruminococcus sp.]
MSINSKNQEQEKKKLNKKQKIIISVTAVVSVIIILLLILLLPKKIKNPDTPTLTIVTPPKQSISAGEEFSVDVSLSALGEELYPAVSASMVFDSSHLEFTGISEGDIMILGDERADGNSRQLPEWSVDIERSNKTGQINVMYLDMTGGKYAFTKECMEDNHILMKLNFKLRGSAKVGDIYNLEIKDSVFATTDESKNLASINDTLITNDGKVVIIQ